MYIISSFQKWYKDTRKKVVEVKIDGASVIAHEEKDKIGNQPEHVQKAATASMFAFGLTSSSALECMSPKFLSYHNLINMSNNTVIRSSAIDILKAISALLVIFIHTGFPGFAGTYVVAISRMAVPIFLLISGYFFPAMLVNGKVLPYMRKLCMLSLGAMIFYAFVFQVNIEETFTLYRLKKLIVMSLPFAGDHLWYLFSLLNVLVLLWFSEKIGIRHYLYYLIFILLLANYFLSFYPEFWRYRNFLFTSLPYFLIGAYIRERNLTFRLSLKSFISVLIVELILMYIELLVYEYYNFQVVRDHYLMTFVMSLTVFIYTINCSYNKENFLSILGRKYSAYIYIFHMFILFCWSKYLVGVLNGSVIVVYFKPFIVYVMTFFVLYIAFDIFNRFSLFIKSKTRCD